MASSMLLDSSGNDEIDRIMGELIQQIEVAFPGRVRGYYLVGSYAMKCPVWTSDLDMVTVFKNDVDATEQERCKQIVDAYRSTCRYPVDLIVDSEERLHKVGTSRMQFASRLVFGEDMRAALPLKPIDDNIRDEIHLAYRLSGRVRGAPERLTFPLDYPDPRGEFYGYASRQMSVPDGTVRPCTKELVLIVVCIATARLGAEARQYVHHKSELLTKYRRWISDDWTELVEDVYACCRNRWAYLIPEDGEDRALLRRFCEQTLAFENDFLKRYPPVYV